MYIAQDLRTVEILLVLLVVSEIADWIAFLIIQPWRWYPKQTRK